MGALLSFILQIILMLIAKQKKEAAQKITGKKNPSQFEISQAYKKLIEDFKKMKSINLDVSKMAYALQLNLYPKQATQIGLKAYQDTQYYLDRILNNKIQTREFNITTGNTVNKIILNGQDDSLIAFFPFMCNSFKSIISPRKIFIVRNGEELYYIDNIIKDDYKKEFEKIEYKINVFRFLEIMQEILCNYYHTQDNNIIEWYKKITNKFLNEKNISIDIYNYIDDLFNFLGSRKIMITSSVAIVTKERSSRYSNNFVYDKDLQKKIKYSSYKSSTENLKNFQLHFNNAIFKSFFEGMIKQYE